METVKRLLGTERLNLSILGGVATIAILIGIYHTFWPIYLLIGFWAYVLLMRGKKPENTRAGLVFTFLFLAGAYIGGIVGGIIVAKTNHAPVLATVIAWANPLPVLKYLFTGIGGSGGADKVRLIWEKNQMWYVPVLLIVYFLLEQKYKNDRLNQETLHGSATWGEPKEEKLTGHRAGFLLGKDKSSPGWRREVVLPLHEVCEHILIDGAPGAGKSTAIFISNMLRMAGYDERKGRSKCLKQSKSA